MEERGLSGGRGVAGKGGQLAARRAYLVIRSSAARAASCRQRRQAAAKPGFARLRLTPSERTRAQIKHVMAKVD
jgi:hypothetical protein